MRLDKNGGDAALHRAAPSYHLEALFLGGFIMPPPQPGGTVSS